MPAVIRHRWNLLAGPAMRLQERLAGLVRIQPLPGPVRLVAAVDLSFPSENLCLAGVVVWDVVGRRVVEQRLARRTVRFPYVPGLLSFREGPAAMAAIRRLGCRPDVLLFDAQGLAHPRGLGLASHIGLLLDRPSIGCAKSRLCGTHGEPPEAAGGWCPLVLGERTVGAVLRTRPGVRPVYVSVGHRVTLEDAVAVVMACVDRYRLPAPCRLAHQLVTRHRRSDRPA